MSLIETVGSVYLLIVKLQLAGAAIATAVFAVLFLTGKIQRS